MSGQTSKEKPTARGSTDREMWSEDLAWLLTQSDSDLGMRSTTGSVISVIEHGGVTSSADSNAFHEAMVTRIGKGDPVGRSRRLSKRWHALPQANRRVLLAHYVGAEMGRRFESKFGLLAAVVVQLWLRQMSDRRATTAQRHSNVAGDQLEIVYEELWAAEALAPPGTVESWDRRLVIANAKGGFRSRSAAGIAARARSTLMAVRTLKSQRDALLSAHAAAPEAGDLERDLESLGYACTKGEPPGLRVAATDAIRTAHRAWNASGPIAGEVRTKRELRKERVDNFFRREGL